MSDNITLPREVVQEALEALERSVVICFSEYDYREVLSDPKHFVNQAIFALRTALAAPDELKAEIDRYEELRQMWAQRVADNERLREALGKYGRHLDGCAVTLGGYQCTCGFNQQEVPR